MVPEKQTVALFICALELHMEWMCEAYFIKRRHTHGYDTRQAGYIETAKCKTTYMYGKRWMHYIHATKWNNLEETVITAAYKIATIEQKISQYGTYPIHKLDLLSCYKQQRGKFIPVWCRVTYKAMEFY